MSAPAASRVVSPFAGHALLVSGDLAAIRLITTALQRFAFSQQVSSELESATQLLTTRKFHVIVVDVAFEEDLSKLLDVVRRTPSNQSAVTFAIIDSRIRSSSQISPNFFIQKPLTGIAVASSLKAALGSIIRGYRRYFRYPLKLAASMKAAGAPASPCELMNISEGGLALNLCQPLELGARIMTRFTLPDVPEEFNVEGEVCWSDGKCRAGLRFCDLTPEQTTELQKWLSTKIEETFPESIMQLFAKNP
jgi:PilZ domain